MKAIDNCNDVLVEQELRHAKFSIDLSERGDHELMRIQYQGVLGWRGEAAASSFSDERQNWRNWQCMRTRPHRMPRPSCMPRRQ